MSDAVYLKAVSSMHININSQKKNGDIVGTPVWFANIGEDLFVRTVAASGKIKRINRCPTININPCDAQGNIEGNNMQCQAFVLANDDPIVAQAESALQKKYGEERTKMTAMMAEQKMPLAYLRITQ